MKSRFPIIAVTLFFSMNGWAANSCANYIGQIIEAVSVDSVFPLLNKIPMQKSEYESTKEFETRVDKAQADIPNRLLKIHPVNQA